MTYPAIVVRVLIASPGDAVTARDRVERALHEWNASRSAGSGVVLMPVRWESHGVPVLDGTDGQSVLNAQLVDQADVVIAFFESKLGTATPRGLSGTAEEIDRALKAGKPVHVWFSGEPLPRDADLQQVADLRKFQETLKEVGLFSAYGDLDELAFGTRLAIEQDVAAIIQSDKTRLRAGSAPRGPIDHESPKPRLRARLSVGTGGNRKLTIANTGTAPAEQLSVQLITEADRELALHGENPVTILDGSDYSWNAWLSLADATPRLVRLTWLEDGVARTLEQSI